MVRIEEVKERQKWQNHSAFVLKRASSYSIIFFALLYKKILDHTCMLSILVHIR